MRPETVRWPFWKSGRAAAGRRRLLWAHTLTEMDGIHWAAIDTSGPKDRALLRPDDRTPGNSVQHGTTELQTLEWQQGKALLASRHLSQNTKGKIKHSRWIGIRATDILSLQWGVSGRSHDSAPAMRGAINQEKLSAALLMWDSGHFSVTSQLGIEEHAASPRARHPDALAGTYQLRKGHKPIKKRFHRPLLKAVTQADMWEITLAAFPSK